MGRKRKKERGGRGRKRDTTGAGKVLQPEEEQTGFKTIYRPQDAVGGGVGQGTVQQTLG